MSCCHYYSPTETGDCAFSIDASRITFGAGCLTEVGDHARHLGLRRVALFTDKTLAALEPVRIAAAYW